MNGISQETLMTLAQKPEGTCVSIFMPTHRIGTEAQQDPIRFKNLLQQAEEQLVASGLRRQAARDLLAPAQTLDHTHFWQHQSDGLAMFISDNAFHHYRLPQSFEALVVVTDRFHLKPLLPLLGGDEEFYILALSQNQVRLFRGTRFSVNEVDLRDVPQNLAEALKYDEFEQQLQFHTSATQTTGAGAQATMFHGHGVGSDDQKNNLLRYFRQINDGLCEWLINERSPLVLACVDYFLPIYKQANTYSYLLDQGITGNPDEIPAKKLHELAWKIVHPYFQRSQKEAIALYRQLENTEKTANQVDDVVLAAYQGRVESLFVAVGKQEWGRYDPKTNNIHLHQDREAGDEDLLDSAAIQTVLKGGAVYAIAPEEVPGETTVAAVLRY